MSKRLKNETIIEIVNRFKKQKMPNETLLEFIDRQDKKTTKHPVTEVAKLVSAMKNEKIDKEILSNFRFNISDDESDKLLADWEHFNKTGELK